MVVPGMPFSLFSWRASLPLLPQDSQFKQPFCEVFPNSPKLT